MKLALLNYVRGKLWTHLGAEAHGMDWGHVPVVPPAEGRHVAAVLGRGSGAPHGTPLKRPTGAAQGHHLTLASWYMTEALSTSGVPVMSLVTSSRRSRAARGRSRGARPRGSRSLGRRSPLR